MNHHADDVTVQELVRLRVENDKLQKQVETLQMVVRDQHNFALGIDEERKRYRDALAKYE